MIIVNCANLVQHSVKVVKKYKKMDFRLNFYYKIINVLKIVGLDF